MLQASRDPTREGSSPPSSSSSSFFQNPKAWNPSHGFLILFGAERDERNERSVGMNERMREREVYVVLNG